MLFLTLRRLMIVFPKISLIEIIGGVRIMHSNLLKSINFVAKRGNAGRLTGEIQCFTFSLLMKQLTFLSTQC